MRRKIYITQYDLEWFIWFIRYDGKQKWTPIYQSSMTGSAVAAVSIAMTILYENEGKNGRRFSRLI